MFDHTKIAAIYADGETLNGQTVTVAGWARTIRDMKNFGFVELNDGSCFKNLQVVLDAAALPNYKEIAGQNVGAALIVTGTVVLTPEAKQPLELKATAIAVEGTSTPDYPASAAPDEPLLRHLPGAERRGLRHPRVLPEPGLRLHQHPPHHRL